jgi:YgiT-type zinc finger domain-containing protein
MAKLCRCGGTTIEKVVDVQRHVNGRRVVVKGVPASVCPNCNERYFSSKTVKQMDRIIAKNEKKPSGKMSSLK